MSGMRLRPKNAGRRSGEELTNQRDLADKWQSQGWMGLKLFNPHSALAHDSLKTSYSHFVQSTFDILQPSRAIVPETTTQRQQRPFRKNQIAPRDSGVGPRDSGVVPDVRPAVRIPWFGPRDDDLASCADKGLHQPDDTFGIREMLKRGNGQHDIEGFHPLLGNALHEFDVDIMLLRKLLPVLQVTLDYIDAPDFRRSQLLQRNSLPAPSATEIQNALASYPLDQIRDCLQWKVKAVFDRIVSSCPDLRLSRIAGER